MTTVAEHKQRSLDLATELTKRSGGVFSVPDKPLLQKDVFAIALNARRDKVDLWRGNADVTVLDANKRHKQVLLHIHEDAHTVTGTFNQNSYHRMRPVRFSDTRLVIPHMTEAELRNAFNYTSGEEKMVLRGKKMVLRGNPKYHQYKEAIIPHHWTVRVKTLDMTILLGIDEHAYFICQVPDKPKTIAEAHAVLRPKNISDDAVRQGEWFFDPVKSQSLIKELDKKRPYYTDISRGIDKWERTLNGDHMGLVTTHNRTRYATGAIVHAGGRHKPLCLNGWHKVVRNREIINAQQEAVRERNTRQYWD